MRIYQLINKNNASSTICLLVNAGVENEKEKNNGVAHILEHMCVHYIQKKWNEQFGEYVQCGGVTEYDHIRLRIDSEKNSEEKIEFVNYIYQEILNGAMLQNKLFIQSIEEVKQEYLERKADVEEQRKIVGAITKGALVTHPVGAQEALEKIQYQNVENFYQECYRNSKIALISISNREFQFKLVREEMQKSCRERLQAVEQKQVQLETFYQKDSFRHFLMEYSKSQLSCIEKSLLLCIIEERMKNLGINNCSLYCKDIAEGYRFIYVKGTGEENIPIVNKIIKDILTDGISEGEIEFGKQALISFIEVCKMNEQKLSYSASIETIISDFLYKDELLLEKSYDSIYNTIKKIEKEEIERKICKCII